MQFQPIKQELNVDLQEVLSTLQDEAHINEAAMATHWAFKGFALYMQLEGSRGQWRWMLTCPLSRLSGGLAWSAQFHDRTSAPLVGIPLLT